MWWKKPRSGRPLSASNEDKKVDVVFNFELMPTISLRKLEFEEHEVNEF